MSSTHSAYTGDVCRARVDRCAGRMMCEFADSALVRAEAGPAWGGSYPRGLLPAPRLPGREG
jgi:hypothetical protein